MKTAISIPDEVFESAEKLAEKLGTSRSNLYTQALSDFVAQHAYDGVAEKLNEVYGKERSTLNPTLGAIQTLSLPKEDW
jgi:predicted transcriptional regulator